MRKTILVGITALLMNVMIPIFLLVPLKEPKPEEAVLVIYEPEQKETVTQSIRLGTEHGILKMDLETYLIGVVLSEMPGSFELEALKAQAIAARTFALNQMTRGKHQQYDLCSSSTCCQAWCSEETLMQKLGGSATSFLERGKRAVKETAGMVLTYDGALIDAVYFSCSGGSTEDAVAVWGSEVPYLKSVPSLGEETAGKYQSTISVPFLVFKEKLQEENAGVVLGENPHTWIGNITLTKGEGVDTVWIGGQSFAGTQLRRLFGLNSTKFIISVGDSDIVFLVYGYGHRVGMSQYGANAMAKAGKNYEDILLYYYSDVELEIKNP